MITVYQVIFRSLWTDIRKFIELLLVMTILLVWWLLNPWYLIFWKLRTREILSAE